MWLAGTPTREKCRRNLSFAIFACFFVQRLSFPLRPSRRGMLRFLSLCLNNVEGRSSLFSLMPSFVIFTFFNSVILHRMMVNYSLTGVLILSVFGMRPGNFHKSSGRVSASAVLFHQKVSVQFPSAANIKHKACAMRERKVFFSSSYKLLDNGVVKFISYLSYYFSIISSSVICRAGPQIHLSQ